MTVPTQLLLSTLIQPYTIQSVSGVLVTDDIIIRQSLVALAQTSVPNLAEKPLALTFPFKLDGPTSAAPTHLPHKAYTCQAEQPM